MGFWNVAPVPGLGGERQFSGIGDVLDQQREFVNLLIIILP